MSIEVSDAAKDRLIELGWEPTLGARPLRRAVQHEIEDRLSEQILHSTLNPGDHVKVDFVKGEEGPGEFVFETGRKAAAITEKADAGAEKVGAASAEAS
jgi:ATP-dependent Clp protease ATP-binding subunit ClpC